jgi:hypothetical protein
MQHNNHHRLHLCERLRVSIQSSIQHLVIDFVLGKQRVADAVQKQFNGLRHVGLEGIVAVDHLLPGSGSADVSSGELKLLDNLQVASVRGALEGQLLEQVRDAGGLLGLVNGAGIHEDPNARRRPLSTQHKKASAASAVGLRHDAMRCEVSVTGTSSEAMRMPLGSVVIRVGLRVSLSGRGGGRSRPGRGRSSEDSAAAPESRRAAASTPLLSRSCNASKFEGNQLEGGRGYQREASPCTVPCGGGERRSAASRRGWEGSRRGGGVERLRCLVSSREREREQVGKGRAFWAVGF